MSNMEAIRTYFQKCPLLADNKINIDGLSDVDLNYSIDMIPADPIVKSYVDGSSIQQIVFVLTLKSYYKSDVNLIIQTSGFYEKLSEWLVNQNLLKNLFILEDGIPVQSIEAQTDGYLYSADRKTSRYQIKFRLLYLYQV